MGESEKTLCRIALDRLCIPFALLPEAQGIYSAYLAAHAASAAAPLIARRDTESLQLVLKLADEESRRQIALGLFPVRLERGRSPDPWRPAPPQAENL